MSTHNLQLMPFPGKYQFDGNELPDGPRANIVLKASSRIEYKQKNGSKYFTAISPRCLSFDEINFQVERLIKELNTIRIDAKRFFSKEKEKQNKAIQNQL